MGVFVFNPFAEGFIARGKAFTPGKHQALLAQDLANLPQFLCGPQDVVLVSQKPRTEFLDSLSQAGFGLPEFVELQNGRIEMSCLGQRRIGSLRPWGWGPDSVALFGPLLGRLEGDGCAPRGYYTEEIGRLYSKAWSAGLLRRVLARWREQVPISPWLCSEQEVGVGVETVEEALEAVAAIRRAGHQRVLVKEALGVAGHNALRLWEPEVLAAQQQWLGRALAQGGQLVVERWLEREFDLSVQLEMERGGLKVCGYTGLLNDLKGQFQANWAEADFAQRLPSRVRACFDAEPCGGIQRLYSEIFSQLESELRRVGFVGPVSIDAFVYRTTAGECRLKPVVEINPRYTMGRLTVELMKQAAPGCCGLFRLVNKSQMRAGGFADLASYARALKERAPLQLEGEAGRRIRSGAVCLNDPVRAQVCLATFEVAASASEWGERQS